MCKLAYTGVAIQRYSDDRVLVNVGKEWKTARYKDVIEDFKDILEDAEETNGYMLWYDYGVGGES